jgi:hypothetical protein
LTSVCSRLLRRTEHNALPTLTTSLNPSHAIALAESLAHRKASSVVPSPQPGVLRAAGSVIL